MTEDTLRTQLEPGHRVRIIGGPGPIGEVWPVKYVRNDDAYCLIEINHVDVLFMAGEIEYAQ